MPSTPVLIKNQLTINQGQTVLITNSSLFATDADTPPADLVFTASNVQRGYFSDLYHPGVAITTFLQQKVFTNNLQFTADGSTIPPSYAIAVSNGNVTTAPAAVTVNFNLTPASSNNNTVRNGIIGGTISGVFGLFVLGLKLYLTHRAAKDLQITLATTENSENIRPIVNKVFDRIDTSGFLGYRSLQKSCAYISAISKVVSRLEERGMNVDLLTMSAIEQNRFLNEIAKQIRKHTVAEISFFSKAKFCSFFLPEVTPQQIEQQVDAIAKTVHEGIASKIGGQVAP